MSVHESLKTVEAVVTLRVPRGAMGDLPQGVRDVLAKVHAVHAVEVDEVQRVRPTSFDIYVDVATRLDVAGEDDEAVREALLDGFGIEAVDVRVVEYG